MDALLVIVAELLLIPVILWALIVLDLGLGVFGLITGILVGRQTSSEVIVYRSKRLVRRLLGSLALLGIALIVIDLFLFAPLVGLVLASVDEREDLQLSYANAEGSFILGRIELQQLELSGRRGPADDPSARFEVSVDSLVIDIDTAALLAASLAVEELALEGVEGRYDRLRRADPRRAPAPDEPLAREFLIERVHVGELDLRVHDHTRAPTRELELELDELDLGPLRSDHAAFDLLYRSRGRGRIAWGPSEREQVGFDLVAHDVEGRPQTTLEVHDLPLDQLGAALERSAGVRASGTTDLRLVNRYVGDVEPAVVELSVALQLRELELRAGEGASLTGKLMLELAERALTKLGHEFPIEFTLSIDEQELAGARSLAESGVAERIAQALAGALRDELRRAGER